jgi:leucyl-tRNA synthetase
MYVGGAEHAIMHLLYARFIHKFLRDLGWTYSDEPFRTLLHQGTITNEGAKMSKSRGNVVNPDEFTSRYGSDVFRMYLMFMGPYELGGDWSDKGISGVDRFAQRTYELFTRFAGLARKTSSQEKYDINSLNDKEKPIYRKTNQTVKKFEDEINNFRFNTAIASLMELINELRNIDNCSPELQLYALSRFSILLAPVAPHLAEECWQLLGNENSIFVNPFWYKYDEKALVADTINIAVQVNGRLRDTVEVPLDSEQDEVKKVVFKDEKVTRHTEGKSILKEIYVKNKIYNIVVK